MTPLPPASASRRPRAGRGRVLRIGLLALCTAAAAGGTIAIPALAQTDKVESRLELEGRRLSLSSGEMDALSRLGRAVAGRNRTQQDAALERARSLAQSPDARYALARYQLELGRQRADDRLRAEALDVLIAGDMTPAPKLESYLAARGDIAFRNRDFDMARTLWTRLLTMRPNDPDVLANLAQVSQSSSQPAAAANLLERAIERLKASGKPVPETMYRQWLSLAHEARLQRPGLAAARALVTAYPTARNWRDALVVYRQLVAPADALEIDHLRLMRAAGVLAKGEEYQRMAQLLNRDGAAVEAKKVLDEAVSRGLLDGGRSPTREIFAEIGRAIARARPPQGPASAVDLTGLADGHFGAGRYAEAAPLYRSALAGPGSQSARVNNRLGMALALAGRRAEAEAAFRLAASDTGALPSPGYPDLASFWLIWLAHPPVPAAAQP